MRLTLRCLIAYLALPLQCLAQQPQGQEASFTKQPVTIPTASPQVTLAGTLRIPAGQGKHPAVLLLAGDGPHGRDQVISGSPMFGQLADHLARNGIAALSYDKRGIGESTGPKNIDDSTTADFAADATACLEFLRQQPMIDAARIGLVGHSEGASIASLLAVQDPMVACVVLIAPPAVDGGKIWMRQRLHFMRKRGVKQEILTALEAQMKRLVEFVAQGKNDDETYYRLGHEFLAVQGLPEKQNTRVFVDKVISDLRSPWYRHFFASDPCSTLARMKTPTLAILSSADEQVPIEQNLLPFTEALLKAQNPDFALVVLPDHDHFFLKCEGKTLKKHNFARMEISKDVLDAMTPWLLKRLKS